MDNLTAELERAQQEGDTRRVFALHRELGNRDERLRLAAIPGRNQVENPIQEREEWKEHFRKIQEGREIAEDRVWENVSGERAAHWMVDTPSEAEIRACGMKMKSGKAAGMDGFLAEDYKVGSEELQAQIHGVVQCMWVQARDSRNGLEARNWPESWNKGLVIPLWKNKGDKSDKTTWRGVTLLSVGSKLLARVVADRTQRWSEAWLHEAQAGFRKGRGVDDVLQVTRRVVEEATSSQPDDAVILIRLFDIEKAYPRVSKDTLWKLMNIKGAPEGFIKTCQGLHEFTRYAVRIHGGVSSEYEADKGLREGCPSSPPLFNVYHHGVMEDFRVRRRLLAQQTGHKPGIQWVVKADGRIDHGVHSREHLHNKAVTVTLGDVGFADDTCLMGEAEEMRGAEQLLENTMRDWRAPFDAVVRHVGGRLMETGGQQSDTSRRRSSGFHKIAKTARSWQFGTRSQQRKIPHSIRVKIMKAVLMPTLTCLGRSRSWTRESVKSMQQDINHAVHR